MAGKFEEVGNFVARGAGKVDATLVDILRKAADITGMKVEAYSGYRPYTGKKGGTGQHTAGKATDIRIIGPDGKPLDNYQTPETFPQYEKLAQAARQIQMEQYPELDKAFRWGGYFSGDKGKYGAMDLMHFDLGGSDKLGMAGGSWDKGLNEQQASLFPGVKSSGALAFAAEPAANGAAGALDAMADGTLKPNPVKTVAYVPPPFSGQQGDFAPLVTIPPLQPQTTMQQPEAAPAPPVAPAIAAPADQSEDMLRSWGLDQSAPEVQAAPAQQATPDDALVKAWGLDKTDAAPAEKMATTQTAAPAAPSTLNDVISAGASGMARGAADLVGLPGTIQNAFDSGVSKITGDIASLWGGEGIKAPPPSPLSGAGLRAVASKASDGATEYTPKTTEGKFASTVGEFAPGALLGPGNALANVVKYGVIPGLASEAAGQVTEGTSAEPYARIGAGLVSPLAVEGGLRVAETAGNKLLSMTPTGAAANNLKEALAASGTTVGDIGSEMARNPRLNAMDIDPNLQQMGMNLANQGGAPRSILNDAVENRLAGAKGAVEDAYDAAIGGVPDVKVYLDNLKATTQANGKKAFGDALTGAKPVDITPVLDTIDKTISPGVQAVVGKASAIPQGPVEQALARVRSSLANDTEMLTDAERLHQIQSQLRIEADTLAKSSSGQDKLVASALRKVRSKIVDQIDDATGGKFKPAQQQYADDNAIQEAFDKGREVFKNGTGDAALENRPEYWEAWKKDATGPELEAAKVGARVAVDQTIRGVRNAAQKGAALGDVDLNTARLEVLLGKSETAKLSSILKDEQKIAQTNAKLFSGSQTAPRQAVNKLTEVSQVTPGISLTTPMAIGGGYTVAGLPGAAAGAGLSLGRMGVQAAAKARDIARNRLMAEALSGDVTRLKSAVEPAMRANRLLAPIRGAQSPLLRSAAAVPVNLLGQNAAELTRPGKR
jgi:hypothetical protein